MSQTPETDAAEMPIDRVDTIASRPACIVDSDFARMLERERDSLLDQRDLALRMAKERERERDEAREIATELAQCLTVAKREGFDPRLMEVCEAVLGRWEDAK